jgi:hypothetical protein
MMIRRPAAVGVIEDDNVRVDKIWVQVGENSLSLTALRFFLRS